MLEKGILVTLITGFTAVVVTVWITVDFCLYRRKKAAIRAAKADTFCRRPHSERVEQPFQKKKEKKVSPTPKPTKKKLSVRKFVNFFTGKKGATDGDGTESVTKTENNKKETGSNSNKGSTVSTSKVEAGGSSKPSSSKPEDKENRKNGLSKEIILEGGTKSNSHSSPNGSVLGKIHSAPNITGKWTNVISPSEIPTGKKGLPPLKGQSTSKPNQEVKPIEHIKDGDDIQPSATSIELNELKHNKVKSKPPLKQRASKTKIKTESDFAFSANEQNGTEQRVNANEVSKKPPLLKRISRNRVDSVNDGSTSSTETRETFMEDRGSSTSSSWTCDETSRKRTGSLSDSTTSSGSIELEKKKFRLKPLKRNQSNMSVSDTTPLT